MDLLQFLIKKKVIEKKQGSHAKDEIKKTGKSAENILLQRRFIPEGELFKLKSEFIKVPLKEVVPENIPSEVLSIVPRESVEFYKIAPLAVLKRQGVLEVGMVYPEDAQAQEAIKFLARQRNLVPKIFLITVSSFQKCLKKYRAPEREVEKVLHGLEKELNIGEDDLSNLVVDNIKTERLVEEAPVIKMVAVILRQAVDGDASDIHIEPTRTESKVRYRMDGILYPSLTLPIKAHPAIVARVKILARLKIDETRIPQDGRFSTKISDKVIDFRVSTFPTTLGEKVVLRVLAPDETLQSLEGLGVVGLNLAKTDEAVKKPYGMILVTGPTGSGKTTTLYAMMKILNKVAVNIVTLEDPVEYFMEGIAQSQVKPEIDYTFARGLRQILRQDPDIIMVGEIRDEETANLAVHAALTGHLVLSTLHTNTAPGAIPRLTDMGIKPFLIPPTLALVLSQRLLRKLCKHCKKKIKADAKSKKYILDTIKDMPNREKVQIENPMHIYKAVGCKKCNDKGYSGRIGIFEAMHMTETLADVINTTPNELNLFRAARKEGMVTLIEDGILKVLKGITSLEEIMRVAEQK